MERVRRVPENFGCVWRQVIALTVVSFLALGCLGRLQTPERSEAAGVRDAVSWQLGPDSYPAHTHISHARIAHNGDIQQMLGYVHISSYDALGRIDDAGWLQVGRLTLVSHLHGKRVKHALVWTYGVSVFPTADEAAWAAANTNIPMHPLLVTNSHGRMGQFIRHGNATTYIVLGAARVTVELACTVKTWDRRQYGSILRQSCRRLRDALTARVSLATAPNPTSTPTLKETPVSHATTIPTHAAPATSTPTVTRTATPTSTQTAAATGMSTDTATATGTPVSYPTLTPTAVPPTATNTPVPTPTPVPPTATDTPPVIYPTPTQAPPTATDTPPVIYPTFPAPCPTCN